MPKYTLLLLMMIVSAGVSENRCEISYDDKGKLILSGEATLGFWLEYTGWEIDFPGNIPDKQIDAIKSANSKNNFEYLLFAGSWCGDSRSQMAEIFYIFESAGIDNYNLIGVGRDKREQSGRAGRYQIERVPTLVILNNGKEAGRVTEFPEKNWADDILNILDSVKEK